MLNREQDQPHDWKLSDAIDFKKMAALGISPEFWSDWGTLEPGETFVARRSEYHEMLKQHATAAKERNRRFIISILKPRGIRGGAVLRFNGLKFHSMRLARLWWKEHVRNDPDFDWKAHILKGELGTMYGMTVTTLNEHVVPGAIPHYKSTILLTDQYRALK